MDLAVPNRSLPLDSPGPDVNERLGVTYVVITITTHVRNLQPRTRTFRKPDGRVVEKKMPREERQVQRTWLIPVANHVRTPGGEEALVTEVARAWFKRLRWEGWPKKVRNYEEDVRPGA